MGKMVFSVKRRKQICLLFWGIDKEKAIKLEFFAPFMRKYTLSGSPQRLRRSFFSTNHWKIFPVLLKTPPFPLSFDRILKCINMRGGGGFISKKNRFYGNFFKFFRNVRKSYLQNIKNAV